MRDDRLHPQETCARMNYSFTLLDGHVFRQETPFADSAPFTNFSKINLIVIL